MRSIIRKKMELGLFLSVMIPEGSVKLRMPAFSVSGEGGIRTYSQNAYE